jgi:hypothetical protein
MRESGVAESVGLEVPEPTDEAHESRSDAQPRQFKQLCDDLTPGGAAIYSYYRVLGWFSHATNYVIDLYTDLENAESCPRLRLRLRRRPSVGEDLDLLFSQMCAIALVLAASALDMLDVERTQRPVIEAIAAKVGCAPELHLSERARQRLVRR